jgi:hypothetical protein
MTAFLAFSALALAQNTIASNTTAGENRVGWVSSGSGRSTSDILWSCFSILLVCTWKCVHLNLPRLEESTAGWLKWVCIPYWPERPLLWKWLRKIGWMGVIVMAPELGVAMAMGQYLEATEFARRVKGGKGSKVKGGEVKGNKVKGDELTKTHAFYANMGGFIMKLQAPSHPEQDKALTVQSIPVSRSQS